MICLQQTPATPQIYPLLNHTAPVHDNFFLHFFLPVYAHHSSISTANLSTCLVFVTSSCYTFLDYTLRSIFSQRYCFLSFLPEQRYLLLLPCPQLSADCSLHTLVWIRKPKACREQSKDWIGVHGWTGLSFFYGCSSASIPSRKCQAEHRKRCPSASTDRAANGRQSHLKVDHLGFCRLRVCF